MPSGPAALRGLRFLRSLVTPGMVTYISGMVGKGLWPRFGMDVKFSWVNTEQNCSFKMLAFSRGSLKVRPAFLRGETP